MTTALETAVQHIIELRSRLEVLLEAIPSMSPHNAQYFLFLRKFEKFFQPFWDMYSLLAARCERLDSQEYPALIEHVAEGRTCDQLLFLLQPDEALHARMSSSLCWFRLQLRDFIFRFASHDDYAAIFGTWNVRPTPTSFLEASEEMSDDIALSMVSHALHLRSLTGRWPGLPDIQEYIFDLIRRNIFKCYASDPRSYQEIQTHLRQIEAHCRVYGRCFLHLIALARKDKCLLEDNASCALRGVLEWYQLALSPEEFSSNRFLWSGVEIEFQAPLEEESLEKLAKEVRVQGGLSLTSHVGSPEVYAQDNVGVFCNDESLPWIQGFFSCEFASGVLKRWDDVRHISEVVGFFNRRGCGVDCSAGLHVHISRDSLSIETLKILALRFARMERLFRRAYFSQDRFEDLNFYAPSLLSLWATGHHTFERTVSYLLLTHFVRRAFDLDSLRDAVSGSCRYTSLYLGSKYETVEFRGHPGTLSEERILHYLQSLQALVAGCHRASSASFSKKRLREAVLLRQSDPTKRMRDPLYTSYCSNSFDSSSPPTDQCMDQWIALNRRVADEIVRTGKLPKPTARYKGLVAGVSSRYPLISCAHSWC